MTSALIISLVLCQNALDGNLQRGGGTDLDRNLGRQGQVNQPVAQQDYRARNLVVTGDVAGGRGFRGTVGYSAEGDFQGTLGSDASRSFRANSALSSVSSLGNLPMNDRYGMATGIGAVAYRRETTATPISQGIVQRAPGQERIGYSAMQAATASADRLRLDLATRTSSASHEYSTLYEPLTLKTVPIAGGYKAKLIASPFNGLIAVPTDDLIESISLGVYGSSLMRADLRYGRADKTKIAQSYITVNDRSAAARLDTKVQPSVQGAPKNEIPPQLPGLNNAYNQIANAVTGRVRSLRQGAKPADAAAAAPELSLGEAIAQVREGFMRAQDEDLGIAAAVKPAVADPLAKPAGEAPEEVDAVRKLTAAEVVDLLGHKELVDRLDGGSDQALDVLLATGESSLRNGRYMSAERAFVMAALVAPANPLPLVGVANSQLAAGLDLSAAVALRNLFMNYPEMIAVRYTPELLGPDERVRGIAQRAIDTGATSRHAADNGLLAAYVGYQLGDRTMTERGLELLAGSPNETQFASLLKSIWLRSEEPPPAGGIVPAPAP